MQEGLTAKGKSLGSTLASGARNIKAQLLHGTTEMNPQKGIMPSIGRGATRAMAAMQIANIGSNILRKRQKDEGFFESLGRRTGNIGETLVGTAAGATPYTRALSTLGKAKTIASVGGSVARAAGFNRAAKALESLPGVGDIGASVGRQIDTGLAGARKAGLEARQRFGGGISYQQQKAQALDGQQFKHKAEYQ